MDMQTVIVVLIVAVAAFFLIRRFYSSLSKGTESTCGCSCEGCRPDQTLDCTDNHHQPRK